MAADDSTASPRARLVVLVSGSGTNLQALIDAIDTDPDFGAEIVAVGADREDIAGLERAELAEISTFVVKVGDFTDGQGNPDRATWDETLTEITSIFEPDLVVSAGFMKLLGPKFLAAFPVVNTHPALLPSFPGTHAVRDALAYGVTVTGCTVHFVDAGIDTGPVIAQQAVAVEPGDDEATLHERIKSVERELLVDVVRRLSRDPAALANLPTAVGSGTSSRKVDHS
jgi:phosphoribosylglycinamide formyltransferase 1